MPFLIAFSKIYLRRFTSSIAGTSIDSSTLKETSVMFDDDWLNSAAKED